ncbi:DUF2817 domain-containing protein [Rhodospirillaceae bacterium KN72]|uniref:DUF2817 domain-containing protein n=1 Tax=Pacificispira spongiicola TaxID=2729598 RepID=A0A7Y0E254_9PROT|nr:DUF2817 domain-containing protein [Pacificispira spongiicola]NMM45825.1 DUF2817 domain-containing protein [Pacificispira spongiicola]
MTGTVACFSESITQARERFLTACDRIGLRVVSFRSDLPDPSGTTLHCDTTRLGSPEARKSVVLCSGAAGPAGLYGCAAALGVLTEGGFRDLPRDISLILVHAANPGGPIWPYLETTKDGEAVWSDDILSEAERRFSAFQQDKGFDWNRLAERPLASMSPPAWPGSVLKSIADTWLSDMRDVCLIDPRSGLGPSGEVAFLPCSPDRSAGYDRAVQWFAPSMPTSDIDIGTTPCAGGLGSLLSATRHTEIMLEVGTYSLSGQFARTASGRPAALTACPSDPVWRGAAWRAVRDALRLAYKGLARD